MVLMQVMAKIRDLQALYSEKLGIAESSVHVLAMMLRKAKLIHTTGRGRPAADMAPNDATNLLLAALGGGAPTKSASTVRAIREAKKSSVRHEANGRIDSGIPEEFAKLGDLLGAFTIADALNAMIAARIAGASNSVHSLSILRVPGGFAPKLIVKNDREVWTITFYQKIPGEHFHLRTSSETVEGIFFDQIAEALRPSE
jgi:hypothetical protein